MSKWIITLPLLILATVCMGSCKGKESKPPNILWIQTDEQRTSSLGCYGAEWAKTPNIDRIARRGTVFSRAYAQCPMCMPSRNSQLTARYPQEVNCMINQSGIPFPEGTKTIIDVLKEAGYYTVTYGKQHTSAPVEWNEDKYCVLNKEYSGYFGLNKQYEPEEYGVVIVGDSTGGLIRAGIYPGGEDNPSRIITDWAIDFLRKRDQEQPFFLRVSHNYPHTPVLPSQPWDTLYDHVEIPIVFPDSNAMKSRSSWDHTARWAQFDVLSKSDYIRTWQHYMGLCAQVDHEVGRILEVLDEMELTENTIIIYSSDHGACLGEFGIVTKMTFDDPSWRVPFIWSWPGHIPEGVVNSELSQLMDMGRTLLNLCGMEDRIPDTWRGRDLFNDPSPDAVFGQIGYPNTNAPVARERTDNWEFYQKMRVGICTKRYRMDYTYMKDGLIMPVKDGNLFDLVNDPGELNNLWDQPDYSGVRSSMAEQIDRWFMEIDKPAILFKDFTSSSSKSEY